MRRALMFALCAAAGAVVAMDWTTISVTQSGGEWLLRAGSVQVMKREGQPQVVAYVLHRTPDGETQYQAEVPARYCGAPRGDVSLRTVGGTLVMQTVFVPEDGTVGARLAQALCSARRG